MNELFGIPVGSLLVGSLLILAVAGALVALLGARNPILVRLGVRNVRRRRGRSALIVLGLMLGTTIISAAFTTGDTMSNTIRQTAVAALGETDVVVSATGAATDIPGELGAATGIGYFDDGAAERVREALAPTGLVDGVAPAIIEQVALQAPAQRQNEPGVTLFATDPQATAGFAEIVSSEGEPRSLADLRQGEVFLNVDAASELRVAAGDRVTMLGLGPPRDVLVRDVVDYAGAGTADSAVLMPLARAQELLGAETLIRHVLVSNRGRGTDAVDLSDRVVAALAPVESRLGVEAVAVKQDAIEAADEAGNAFMAFFTTFGSFSIAAGILLVFLIFVMLARERRGELGIARAVGTRRGHLVQMFVFEGLAYDLVAAFVGALLGALVAYGMVLVMAAAFGAADADAGLQVRYAVEPRSIIIAFALGVLLTLVVVAVSAWRVSRMTISSAIRDLPDPPATRTRRRWILGIAGILLGTLVAAGGVSGSAATPLLLGMSIALVGLVPVLTAFGAPERAAFTTAGVGILALWMAPLDWWERIFGELSMDFTTWVTGGLMIVVGATWTLMYNADVVLGAVMRSFGRIRSLAPVLRMAVAYPLSSRFRTGTTLAMFTLVVFNLVTGTSTSNSFMHEFKDAQKFGGGFDVRAGTGATAPITDMRAALDRTPAARPADVVAVGSQSVLAVEATQGESGRPFHEYAVRGLDRSFLEHTTFDLGAVARGYGSPRDVWRALAREPGLAVVDSSIVPRRDNFTFAVAQSDFVLSGFVFDDGVLDPTPVDVRDPQSGATTRVTVIGVLSDTAPIEMLGISTSADTLAQAFPGRALPTIHYFDLAPGVDPAAAATALESAFLANGMEAESIEQVAKDAVEASLLFNRLIQGFMALGLLIGVAALGVISARAVVERRQQIGVLRAIGFRRGMVQATLLVESAFIAVISIVVGTGLGLLLSYEIIRDQRKQPSWEGVSLVVPWRDLAVVFLIVLGVALAATLVPAQRATRIRPAEALRYQ